MRQLFILVEGHTEQTFVNDVLGPVLNAADVYPHAVGIGPPGKKFGDVSFKRARRDIEHLLRNPNACVTTFFDYYGLRNDWPGLSLPPNAPPPNEPLYRKAGKVESAAWHEIISGLGGHPSVGHRLCVYLQMHEYEGLLYSDPTAFARGIHQPALEGPLAAIRAKFKTPEHINDDPNRAPSKRILQLYGSYQKPLDGVRAAVAVGVTRMRRECARFDAWLSWLERQR